LGKEGKQYIDKQTFTKIIESKDDQNIELEKTASTISPRAKMSGFEKCVICLKMLKSCKEGEVFWTEVCDCFYHITCLREYV